MTHFVSGMLPFRGHEAREPARKGGGKATQPARQPLTSPGAPVPGLDHHRHGPALPAFGRRASVPAPRRPGATRRGIAVAGKRLRRCEREYCKGSILTWDGVARCHLCGRSPDSPIIVGAPRQREPTARRKTNLETLAERVFSPPAPAAEWDPALQVFIINVVDV